jgi:hypothetical protein
MKNRIMILGIALCAAMAVLACTRQNGAGSSSKTKIQYNPESDFDVESVTIVESVTLSKSVRITNYRGNTEDVRIPPHIRGLPVTHIGDKAFKEKKLTRVTIPKSNFIKKIYFCQYT